jgi:uncharacterized membrane-anchored protein
MRAVKIGLIAPAFPKRLLPHGEYRGSSPVVFKTSSIIIRSKFKNSRGIITIRTLLALVAAVAAFASGADAKPYGELFPGRTYQSAQAQQFVESLDYQQGSVGMGSIGVQLRVPETFYYLSKEQAGRVLVEVWGNPPAAAENVMGMILPATKTPVDETWGAVITFDEDGYVSDEDAAKINYADLLKELQEATLRGNEERVKHCYQALRLVGWASTPFYDKAAHKLHWAKELQFGEEAKHTLNYDVRVLGRKGVLKMNFVAGMDQLAEIKGVIPTVMSIPEFATGSRYEDYVPGTDKLAAYGIGGLIAGKVLAKAGFFALALAFLKKGWFLIFIVLAGLVEARRQGLSTPDTGVASRTGAAPIARRYGSRARALLDIAPPLGYLSPHLLALEAP